MNGLDTKPRMPLDGPRAWHRGAQRPRPTGASPAPGGARPRDRMHAGDHAESVRDIRLRARRFVDETLRDARLGRAVDARGAHARVEALAATVSGDPGAAVALTRAAEQGDYTSIHCVNVCVLALAFGAHLGLEHHELVPLGVGALLHDLGKTRTPRAILQKAGDLTPDELAIVKRHPEDGYEIMAADPRTPPQALEVIRLHHERLGGHGYPFGLSGDEIPRHVRIAAIADVYDTMTSDRPYRRARSADQALQDLHEHGHACFGAGLVQEFIRCVRSFPTHAVNETEDHATGTGAAASERGNVVAARRIRRAVARVTAGTGLLQYAG